ncbi:MAG TPA: HEAT repeat domain-containing protein [Pyrinomonadaceae bacterium]|nr:HEAT repeat domain-containing protein [Pyrinomonadaceae bacterium]
MQKLNSKTSTALSTAKLSNVGRLGGLTLAAAILGILPLLAQAQRLNAPSRVSGINVQASGVATDISIVADGSLNQAQTWQDSEGYHVVVPNTVAAESLSAGRGVRVRRLGTSLEVLLQVRPGASVNVQTEGNRMQLHVDSRLLPRPLESDRVLAPPIEQQLFEERQPQSTTQGDSAPFRVSSTVEDLGSNPSSITTSPATPSNNVNPAAIVPNEPGQTSSTETVAPSQITAAPQNEGWMASVFSGTSVLIVFSLGLFGLLVSRKLRSREEVASAAQTAEGEWANDDLEENESAAMTQATSSSTSLVKREASSNGSSRTAVTRLPVAGPTSLYGAYRIDQEVGKLILGQTHRLDVLSSRAIDDRRAIEASLIKGANSQELDEPARRRAREALEEYGFVARQCASLLLASDAFERTSAARLLGDIKSPAALPFLLESLYDSESIVRNQAVVSIGELKIPSAIGALLDIARTHPDVPSSLLSRTLSACSVEGLDFFDAVPEPGLLGSGYGTDIVEEITHLEPPAPIEELPEGSDDPALAQALTMLESDDVPNRAEALKALMQFAVQSSVGAMTLVAQNDHEPAIRSQAISALAAINHESVFAAVLLGLSDETREVRAAAARSLSRLSFDRADAYVRVIESGDEETIRKVAKACLQAGIVSQNLDRLASSDHRQAYETFCLICLLAKAKIVEPISEAIANHPDSNVRMKAVHLLACTNEPEVAQQLRELAVRDGMREDVKTTLLDALYRLEHTPTAENQTIEAELVPEEPASVVIDDELPSATAPEFAPEVSSDMDEFEF